MAAEIARTLVIEIRSTACNRLSSKRGIHAVSGLLESCIVDVNDPTSARF